ncbi:MAG TPA: S-layer homology domain-containing protein [Chloroflexia bacterium]|nr:S-layer homology domain-containing protein [Chloroflexia bacterium]
MKNSKVIRVGGVVATLVLLLVVALTIKAFSGAAAAAIQQLPAGQPESWTAQHSDTSPALRDIPIKLTQSRPEADNENPTIVRGFFGAVDNVVQRIAGPLAMPTPIANFEGIPNLFGPLPPDTNGDVGRDQYVQIVNSGFQVWSKTGTSLYGPANNNTLFTGFGGPCEARNDGDPIALYDAIADRWVLTWFTSSAPYMECIAVSASGDATLSWYRYAFLDHNSGTTLGDYPKMGVWPDAYYMSTNEFGGSSGDGNYAYNRIKMLSGDPTAEVVYFHGTDGGKLPSDVDSANNLPPAGSPNYFIEWYDGNPGQLAEFKFHVDFATPANSTYTGPFIISVANFDPNAPSVPQPDTTTRLDNLSDRFMYRLAYRNFGDHESLVVNHTVNVGGVDGIRWYELRDPNNAAGASVYQQGTYAPTDGLFRWMGSIAMDRMGDMALGFSTSSSTAYPSINYTGRLVGDPLGTMPQGEATLQTGTGSEDYPAAHRWGDYSSMQVDPVDDCTFWYTTMYFQVTGERDWRTRIGSFKFPGCTAQGTPTPVASPTAPLPTSTAVPPTPTACPDSINATGAITNTDGTQNGRVGLSDPKSSCVLPKTVGSISDTLTRHYDTYTYTNSTGSAQCVTVNLTQACSNNAIQSITYLDTFNPTSIQTNYLADGGASGQQFSYSFSLPAGHSAVVVVLEVSPNLGCENYNLTINPCSAGGATSTPTTAPSSTATGTNTPVPPTGTSVPTDTAVTTGTAVATDTPVDTNTPTETATGTPPTATETPTACTLSFEDVPPDHTFYAYIQCLACRGIINGYPCGGPGEPCNGNNDPYFRPGNNVTRGQFAKIASNSAGFNDAAGPQQYEDVLPGSTFYDFIWRLTNRGFINGYPCGGVGEPCGPTNLPYFRPNANVTRGQLSKIDANAAGLTQTPGPQQFEDVLPGSTFYDFIWRLTDLGYMNGYPCGGTGEPCGPNNLPYFRPSANATRGQASKIVSNTFFPECQPPR